MFFGRYIARLQKINLFMSLFTEDRPVTDVFKGEFTMSTNPMKYFALALLCVIAQPSQIVAADDLMGDVTGGDLDALGLDAAAPESNDLNLGTDALLGATDSLAASTDPIDKVTQLGHHGIDMAVNTANKVAPLAHKALDVGEKVAHAASGIGHTITGVLGSVGGHHPTQDPNAVPGTTTTAPTTPPSHTMHHGGAKPVGSTIPSAKPSGAQTTKPKPTQHHSPAKKQAPADAELNALLAGG